MNTQYFEFNFRKEYIYILLTKHLHCAHLIEKYINVLLLISSPVNFVTK